MSDHNRGVYTPETEAPLTFDPRDARQGGGGRRPMTLLISAIVLMAMIVGLLLVYRHGIRHESGSSMVVGAPIAATTTPPPPSAANADGDETAGLQIYKSEATPPSETRTPTFEVAPEKPAPLPPPRPEAPPPAVLTPPAPPPTVVHAAAVKPPALRPSPALVADQDAGDTSDVAGGAFASRPAAPTPHKATPKPASAEPTYQAEGLTAAKPKPKAKPVPAPLAPAAEQATTASVAGGPGLVQIGAFNSPDLAAKGWSDAARAVGGRMAGKSRKVEPIFKDGKTLYRTYVTGFKSKADAQAFCAAFKAKGKDCIVR